MRKRSIALFSAPLAVGAAIVGLNVGSAGGVTAAHEYNHIVHAVLGGKAEIKGIVSAAQRGQRRRVRLSVSLHGLKPDTAYRVVVSRRRCSRPSELPIVSTGFIEAAGASTDLMVSSVVRRNGSLRNARSVRVYERAAGGGLAEQRCEPAQFVGSVTEGTGI